MGPGTALWSGELEGTGGPLCRAEDKAKTQRETESLVMSFKQLGCTSLNQSVEFGLKVTTFFLLFTSVWDGLWVTRGHKSFDLYNK